MAKPSVKNPEVSVIIPFGRAEAQFILRAINSIVDQDYKKIEVIICDYTGSANFGGFEDVPFPIRHIKITKAPCFATAANVGAKRAKGKYLLFCIPNAHYSSKYISTLRKNIRGSDLIYSWFDQINAQRGGLATVKVPSWNVLDFKRDRDHGPQSLMIRRDKFQWFDPKVAHFNLWDLVLNLRNRGIKGKIITDPLFDYYYTPVAYDVIQAMSNVIMRKYDKGKVEEVDGIACIIENQSNFSGGRYHSWMHAIMMAEAGYKVKIYTNRLPVFKDDFLFYKIPEIELVNDLMNLDVKAKLYYCSPFMGNYVGLKLAKKYRRNVICQIFDPPHWMEKMVPKKELPMEMVGPKKMKMQIEKTRVKSHAYVSVSTKNAVKGTAKWFGIREDHVLVLPPYINNRALEAINRVYEKNDWIISVSRSVARKSWGETLDVFSKSGLAKKGYKLHIITDDPIEIERKANELGMAEHLEFHVGISDLEKFWLLSHCKAILSTSRFEGYGMWAMEGEETGLPIICYTLPSIKEIKKTIGEHTIILSNELGDTDTMATLLKDNVDNNFETAKGFFGMDANLGTIREAVERLMK